MKQIYVLIFFVAVAFATEEAIEEKRPSISKETVQKLARQLQRTASFTVNIKHQFAYNVSKYPVHQLLLPSEQFLLSLKDGQRDSLVINELVDGIFAEVSAFIIANGYDPVQMPDVHLSFEYKPLIITYHGELDLTRGWLQDISTMHRSGDAIITEQNSFGIIKIPIAFRDLMMDYLYSAKLMNIGPTGSVYGRIDDITAQVDILIDLTNLELLLMDFHLQAGDLRLEFHGNALTDWLVNLFVDLTATLLHNQIVKIADGITENIIRQVIDQINEIIGGIFGRNLPTRMELREKAMLDFVSARRTKLTN